MSNVAMSITETKVIDAIGIDPMREDEVLLTISDHLEWKDDDREHMLLLQEKVNSYLRFIEGGELLEKYPKAKSRSVVIKVFGKHRLNEPAKIFFARIQDKLVESGYRLIFEHLPSH